MQISIKESVLIIKKLGKSPTIEEIKEIKEIYARDSNKIFNYVLFDNVLGYFSGYDFHLNKSIYCGYLSERTALKSILEYIKTLP